MTEPVLDVSDVHHTFGSGAVALQALRGVHLSVERGSFVVIVGRNGSGKSTLLDAIAGSIIADRGVILIDGDDVTRAPEHVRARRIARVRQDPLSGTAPRLTVAENLALAQRRSARRRGLRWATGGAQRRALADRLAVLELGLERRLDTPAASLSGGERQALTLLMATLVRPMLLLLDEHTAALDPRSAEQIVRLTTRLIERDSLTTLMVTHSLPQAASLGDRTILMHDGRLVEEWADARKRRLRVPELRDAFERLRDGDLLDQRAADLLRRAYV